MKDLKKLRRYVLYVLFDLNNNDLKSTELWLEYSIEEIKSLRLK